MAKSLLDEFLTPGWSTSTPGDMKNPTGMPTKFAKLTLSQRQRQVEASYEQRTAEPITDMHRVERPNPDVPQTGMDEAW